MLGMTGSSSSGLIQTLTLLNTICTEVLVRVRWRWRFDTWPRSKVQHSKTCSPVIPKSWLFCLPCHVIQTLHLLFLTSSLLTHHSLGFFFPLWPCWVFTAVWISLAAVSRGYLPLPHMGFSLRWLLLLQSSGPRCKGFSSCSTWA